MPRPQKYVVDLSTDERAELNALLLLETRPVTRALQNGLVWYYCELNKPPSRDTIDRFLADLEHVLDDIFDRPVEQAVARGLLDSTYAIDLTHVETIQYNEDAVELSAEKHYHGFGCTIVSTGAKIPIAAEFASGGS